MVEANTTPGPDRTSPIRSRLAAFSGSLRLPLSFSSFIQREAVGLTDSCILCIVYLEPAFRLLLLLNLVNLRGLRASSKACRFSFWILFFSPNWLSWRVYRIRKHGSISSCCVNGGRSSRHTIPTTISVPYWLPSWQMILRSIAPAPCFLEQDTRSWSCL